MNKIAFILLFISSFMSAQTATYPVEKEGKFKTYISRDNIEFSVGQKLEIGLPYAGNQYTFITQGNVPAGAVITGNTVKISKLKAVGNKDTGYKMYAQFKGYGLLPVDIDIESALKTGEIIIE